MICPHSSPGTCEYYLTLQRLGLRFLRRGPYPGLSRWALNATGCGETVAILTKRHIREGHVKTEAELGVMKPLSSKAGSQEQLEEARTGFCPPASRESMVLLTA